MADLPTFSAKWTSRSYPKCGVLANFFIQRSIPVKHLTIICAKYLCMSCLKLQMVICHEYEACHLYPWVQLANQNMQAESLRQGLNIYCNSSPSSLFQNNIRKMILASCELCCLCWESFRTHVRWHPSWSIEQMFADEKTFSWIWEQLWEQPKQ